jgi:hypothetical protein
LAAAENDKHVTGSGSRPASDDRSKLATNFDRTAVTGEKDS